MKYGFSTLVCPGWQWSEIITSASDLGFNGIELRGIAKELYLPQSKLFSDDKTPSVKAELDRLKLQVICLSTSSYLFDYSLQKSAVKEAVDYMDLAVKLGTPYIRVLADRDPAPGVVDETAVTNGLEQLLPKAEEKGVKLLVETNGVYADSSKLKNLCDSLSHPALGVLWDVHHSFRYFNEPPEKTYENLKDYICHVHIKDSVLSGGVVKYRMIGYGDVPLKEASDVLKDNGYDGFAVLEWVKRWNMDLEEPGIVLPQFINAMKDI